MKNTDWWVFQSTCCCGLKFDIRTISIFIQCTELSCLKRYFKFYQGAVVSAFVSSDTKLLGSGI